MMPASLRGRDSTSSYGELLHSLFRARLDAAQPQAKFDGRLPTPPKGSTIVIGSGKTEASMARRSSEPGVDLARVSSSRGLHGLATSSVEVIEASTQNQSRTEIDISFKQCPGGLNDDP